MARPPRLVLAERAPAGGGRRRLNPSAIRLEGVWKSFPSPSGEHVHAVRELDLTVGRGETVCLIGTSGCGKTTTLRLLNRLEEPTRGVVHVEGEDVRGVDPIRLRRRMGYVIQSGGLFPHLTVRQNVGLLCRLEGWEPARRKGRVEELLDMVHLQPKRFGDRYPCELSGGQRQRVGVARALVLDPPILLMDEPFGALDPITRAGIRQEFQELKRRVVKTVVIVTHDLDEAFELGDRVALMTRGTIAQVGTPAELRETPASDYVRRFVEGQRSA